MKRLVVGIVIGLMIGIGTTAFASRSAGGPCSQIRGRCIVMAGGDNGGTLFIPSLDLRCETVGHPGVAAFFSCDRASVQSWDRCLYGRTGSTAVFIEKGKMWFTGPEYCRINSKGQIVGTTRSAPSSAYWYRTP
jgi:hypothetical protein